MIGLLLARQAMELPGVPPSVFQALKAAALEAEMPRLALVGGVVRDLLLHRYEGRPLTDVPDIDCVMEGQAPRLLEILKSRCGPQRVKAVQEHGAFGTVALQLDGVSVDLATARQEHYPEPAENPVVLAGLLSADLVRRDFTINAMALDLISGELLDPHGGQRDLRKGLLAFLHDNSVRDDPTRVVRAARYGARLGMVLSAAAEQQVVQTLKRWPWSWRSGDVPEMAPPALATRLRMELDRLLEREPWPKALDLLEQWQALSLLDAQLQSDPSRMERLRWAQRLNLPLMPALLAGAANPVAVAQRLQIPARQQQWLQQCSAIREWLVKTPPPLESSPSFWSAALEGHGWQPEAVALTVALRPRQWKPLLRWWGRWRRIQSPQTARDLISAGWRPGPAIGEELRRQRSAALDQSR